MPELTLYQWILITVGAGTIGLAKSGIPGLGILAIPLFAAVVPAKESTGLILPMLIMGDLIGVGLFRQHAQWKFLWKLAPWTILGVLAGWQALGWLDNAQIRPLIGGIVLVMLGLNLWRQRHPDLKDIIPTGMWFAAAIGLVAGFTTMVANAAGPIMVIYLLAMRLPPAAFIGTSAWFFLLVNVFKVPFSAQLGLITLSSLMFNALLLPGIALGAYLGFRFAQRVPKHLFDRIVLFLATAGAIKLFF